MKNTLLKTRHFRLGGQTEAKLLEICERLNECPSEAIRRLIMGYPTPQDRNAQLVPSVAPSCEVCHVD